MRLGNTLLAVALLAASAAAWGQTYRCTGKDGKKYYGQTMPPQCAGVLVEVLSSQGTVVRRIDPEGEEKAREKREADAARKREEDALAKEADRRNRALLATYTSEKDIEDARARALADNAKLVKEVQGRIESIRKRQAAYEKEMEFYSEGKPVADKKGKAAAPAKGAKPPPKLLEDMKMAEIDLKLQEDALEARKKEQVTINGKYDEDKRRFLELTQRNKKK